MLRFMELQFPSAGGVVTCSIPNYYPLIACYTELFRLFYTLNFPYVLAEAILDDFFKLMRKICFHSDKEIHEI